MEPFTAWRVSGILLIVAFVLNIGGVVLFNAVMFEWVVETPILLAWERGLFIAAFVVAALGVAVLEMVLRETGAAVLARLGTTAFLIGAVAALVAEAAFLSGLGDMTPLLVVMVVVLFGAEALLGGALLSSGLVPAWIGWTIVVWNIGWLVVLPVISPGDLYYPILHAIPLLLIGISLAGRARSNRLGG